MKNNLSLGALSKRMLSKEISERIGEKAHLIIDSTLKATRGKKPVIFRNLRHLMDSSLVITLFLPCMNHILLVVLAYNLMRYLHPKSSMSEAQKQVSQSSQPVFLHELKHDFTKFHGNRIVKNKIFQALSAMTSFFPLSLAG